jgi:small subunit ribosomal protein S10
MVFRIRIWLQSTNVKHLDMVARQIKEIAEKSGVNVRGPVPLPVKRLVVPIFRLPHGEGSKYWEHWEMTIHKRLIDIDADERVMRKLIRIQVPDDVHIEIKQRTAPAPVTTSTTARSRPRRKKG